MSAREERDKKPLWDRLIEHNKKSKLVQDQKYIVKRLKDYRKETEGCTFTPQLNPTDYNMNQTLDYLNIGDVYDRNRTWRRKKEIKIDEERIRKK
mmetsp:Transcript_16334/g.14254  ORF Transcript_16334/g.14254 Transcript_16334/m.14254 type:complete len:95 (+) Transcript_16334:424-708(+)